MSTILEKLSRGESLTPPEETFDTLLHLSGGMDSVYCLYHRLKDHPEERILVHHCNLRHRSGDHMKEERQACEKVIEWLRMKGLNNFEYFTNSLDYGNTPGQMLDIMTITLFTAMIIRSHNFIVWPVHKLKPTAIKRIIYPWHRQEGNEELVRNLLRVLVANNLPLPEFVFPIAGVDRKEMIANMPEELLNLVWGCRKPEDGQPCGKCHTCKEYAQMWEPEKEEIVIPEWQLG